MTTSQARDNRPLIIVFVVALALLLCCCLAISALIAAGLVTLPWVAEVADLARVEATERLEKTFEVSTPLQLTLDVNVGQVTIREGAAGEVRISVLKRAWGENRSQAEDYLDDFEVRLKQTAQDSIEIETDLTARLRRLGRTPSADFEITVPRDSELEITTNVGNVQVSGVEGRFDIRSNVGDVTLRDVRFEDDSEIRSDVGNIDLRLPDDVAFTFSAETNVGNIDVEFPVRNERADKRVVGGSLEGEIGQSPTAEVELHTNTGNIKIRRGG